MTSLKGALVKDEYAYRITDISQEYYKSIHKKALDNNVVYTPVFTNPVNNKIDMITWYFGNKRDLDNFLKEISLLN